MLTGVQDGKRLASSEAERLKIWSLGEDALAAQGDENQDDDIEHFGLMISLDFAAPPHRPSPGVAVTLSGHFGHER